MHVNTAFDWDSPARSPAYIEGYVHFKERELDTSMVAIIDVREVISLGGKIKGVDLPPVIVPFA